MTEKSSEEGSKAKLKGNVPGWLVVAGIVLGLVGIAFFISRQEKPKVKSKETYFNGKYSSLSQYDVYGNEIYWTYTDEDGSRSEYFREYDENGNIISCHNIDYYSDSPSEIMSESWSSYIYDKSGNLLNYKVEEMNGEWAEEVYTYDDRNRETSSLYKRYSLYSGNYYSYDTKSYIEGDSSLVIEITNYDYDESTGEFKASEYMDYEELLYDKKGNIVEHSSENTYLMYDEYRKYEYDKSGNVVSEYSIGKSWGEFDYESQENYEYDLKLNKCIKGIVKGRRASYEDKYGGMEYTTIVTYEYDSSGNLIEEIWSTTYFNGQSNEERYNYYYTYYE